MKKSHDRQSMVYCISEQHIHFGSTGPEVLQSNFIEIGIRHERSPLNLLHIFRTSFYKNTEVDGCFGSFHMKNNISQSETHPKSCQISMMELFGKNR